MEMEEENNMEQTAVEWLGKELESYGDPQFCKIEWEQLDSLIQQAKEMEKEQIIESFSLGIISHHDAFKNQNKWDNGEQYYKETFKSE
jgi:hypothetical protein